MEFCIFCGHEGTARSMNQMQDRHGNPVEVYVCNDCQFVQECKDLRDGGEE